MAETSYLGNSIEIRQYAVSIGYTNLQISRIQDKNTLWRGFRCRFRLADLLISCGRKADSCKKNWVQKISGFLWMGPSLHESYTDAFWLNETAVCGCHQETWLCACCWSVSLSLGVDLTLLPVHYLLSRAAGGNCWAGQIKSVDGFVPFRLSYFDCSNLHLFSIFTREDTDPPPPLQGSCLRQLR